MKSRPSYLLVASLILFGGSFAKAEQPPDIVAVEHEPRHMIAFENAAVRVFHTKIPSGYTTLYHRHSRDSIYVQIAGSTNLVNQMLGEPGQPLSMKPGDVFFAAHSKIPRVHRITNLGAEEYVVLDIDYPVADQRLLRRPDDARS